MKTIAKMMVACVALAGCVADDPVQHATSEPAGKDPGPPGNAVFPSDPATVMPGKQPASFPSKHPGMPVIPDHGGPVLTAPVIVTVTFPNDALEADVQKFDDAIGGLSWWSTVHTEYGIGAAKGGGHVSIPDAPPASMTDADVQQWIADRVADGTLPAPTDQTIYALYYPDTTTITLDGSQSCQAFLGYHDSTFVAFQGQNVEVQYAVINRCGDLGQLTETASHEFTEAATDPHPLSNPAYSFLTDNAWTSAGGEDGDMCSMVSPVTEAGYSLTRVWSNAHAKKGDQPCIPVPDKTLPYFNAGVNKDTTTAHPGDTLVLEVDCYSFGALPHPFKIAAQAHTPSILKMSFDKPTCQNGETAKLTIEVAKTAKKGTAYHYEVTADLDAMTGHLWRGLVDVH